MTSSSFRSGNASDDYQEESGILDENIEDQLMEAFDSLTAKSAKTRLVAFEFIRKSLSNRYMIEFIYTRKITLLDAINRSMKRSKGQDLGAAATLISILCAIIGPSPETDSIFSELISHLLIYMSDETIQAGVRLKCARTAAICTFIIGVVGYPEQIMDRLYAIFSASCAKGDGSMPHPNDDIAALHSSCLLSWALLLTCVENLSPQVALDIVEEFMDKITELLDSPHLDVQISAGETLVIMCEIIKSRDDGITAEYFEDLCDKIRELVKDTPRFRGKKDSRQQRSNFRELLAAIEEDNPSLVIKFGRERLTLETWARRRQYDAFCELFGAGLNHHLAENEVLREIFNLGAVISQADLPRVRRSDNSYENMVADKARSKNMRKLRDKRADVID